jgi:hypothetical protein
MQEADLKTDSPSPEKGGEVHMLNIGSYNVTKTRLLALITLAIAVLIWMNVSVAGLPLVPIALAVVAIALLW